MNWIDKIYRNPEECYWDDTEESEVRDYSPQKFTDPDGKSWYLPTEFIEFLSPYWDFIKEHPELYDCLKNPEKYDFIDIIHLLEALPKDNEQSQRFRRACIKFGLVNKQILDIYDMPHISTPKEFYRFLDPNTHKGFDNWEEVNADLDEEDIRSKWPNAVFTRYANVVFAEIYDGYHGYSTVYCKKSPEAYIEVHSNGTSVMSEAFLGRYNGKKSESISRMKTTPEFLNRVFSHPYRDLKAIRAQQDFIRTIMESPELDKLRDVFLGGLRNLTGYSMVLYPIEGHPHHDSGSNGHSIRGLYHSTIQRALEQKAESDRLNQELYDISPELFESVQREIDLEALDQERKSIFKHRVYRGHISIHDPEDPYGTQEYFMEKYRPEAPKIDEDDIDALERWASDLSFDLDTVEIDVKIALDDAYPLYLAAREELEHFFKLVSDMKFPFLHELKKQCDTVFAYFGERYLYRKKTHLNVGIEYGEMKEFDLFMQNLGILRSLFDFIDIILEEGWSQTQIKPGSPNSYTDAWSFSSGKAGQVMESMSHDGRIKVFSSPNTSGKSFLLKRDATVQMAAQAVGYTPADESVLGKAVQSILFFDRPDNQVIERKYNHSIRNHSIPSAFMYEILSIIEILRNDPTKSRAYLDEVCTTTGALDQASIILALIEHLHQHESDIIIATHNEILLQFLEEKGIEGILSELLHLGHEETPWGPKNTYTIEQGRSDSLFLDVCRREQAPTSFIDIAQRYLDGNWIIPQNQSPRTNPKVTKYTSEEREALMQHSSSIMHLFPQDTTFSILKLYSKNGNLQTALQFTQDHLGLGDSRRGWRDRKLFLEGIGADSRYYDMLQRMIFHVGELSSQETLERQKMFESLQRGVNFRELSDILQNLSLFDTCMREITESEQKQKVNTNIFSFLGVHDYDSWIKQCETYKQQIAEGRGVSREREDSSIVESNPTYIYIMGFKNTKEEFSQLEKIQKVIALNKKILGERSTNSDKLEEVLAEIIHICESTSLLNIDVYLQEEDIARLVVLQDQFNTLLQVYISMTPAIPYEELISGKYSDDIADILKDNSSNEAQISKGNKKGQKAINGVWEALYHISQFPSEIEKLKGTLKEVDSVYIKQSLNYLKEISEKIRDGNFQYRKHSYWYNKTSQSGGNQDSLSQLGKIQKENFATSRRGGPSISQLLEERHDGEIQTELLGLTTVLYWAYVIKQTGLGKVTFHEKNELKAKSVRHLNYLGAEGMIANDIHLGGYGPQVAVLTGPNGSGKTYFEQSIMLLLMCGRATGYGPGKNIRMPLIDKLPYLERVMEESKEGLSAGANEIRYWKEIYRELEGSRCPFFIGDEILSVTSPRYQEAGSISVLNQLQEQDILGIVATHNHQAIKAIDQPETPFQPFHFEHILSEEGEITYNRRMRRGHAPSLGIEVAEKMGLDPKIIARAKYYREILSKK